MHLISGRAVAVVATTVHYHSLLSTHFYTQTLLDAPLQLATQSAAGDNDVEVNIHS